MWCTYSYALTSQPSGRCVGVWDTVGSVYGEINALNIVDTSLPATVKVALHALSLQENREKFLPTLWTIPSGGLKPGQVLKQVCRLLLLTPTPLLT